jgi:hypothetical protein
MVDNMTGYVSKRAAARDKLDDDDALTIAYQSGYYDGKKAAQRTWVGLTDEDWKEIEDMPDVFDQGVAWCLARLQRKNT